MGTQKKKRGRSGGKRTEKLKKFSFTFFFYQIHQMVAFVTFHLSFILILIYKSLYIFINGKIQSFIFLFSLLGDVKYKKKL